MRLRVVVAALTAAAIAALIPVAVHLSLGGSVSSGPGVSVGTSTAPGAPLTIGGVQAATATASPPYLTDSKSPGAVLALPGMKPGDSASSHVTITANTRVFVTVYQSSVAHTGGPGNLAHDLQLAITDQTTGRALYSGPFDSMPASTAVCSIGSTGSQCLSWPASESHTFLFTVVMPQAAATATPHLPTTAPATPNPDDAFINTGASTTIVWGAGGPSTSCAGGIFKGKNLEVPNHVVCVLVDYTLAGNAVVDPGGTLQIEGGSFGGNVQSTGGSLSIGPGFATTGASIADNVQGQSGGSVTITAATVHGNVQVQQTGSQGQTQWVCASTVGGNLQVQNNVGTVVIGDSSQCTAGNQVGGNLQVQSNTGPPPAPSVIVSSNTVHGNLQCNGDTPAAQGVPKSNAVHGNIQGECVPLGVRS